jgi:putative sterol carrier protein
MSDSPLAAVLTTADPTELARAVAEAPDELLQDVMTGDLRATALDEVFLRIPDFLHRERTKDVDATLEFRITDGKQSDRYVVVLSDGECRTGRDLDAEPRVSFELGGVDFLKLVTGNANTPIMFVTGRLLISGDQLFAMEVADFFRVPAPTGGSNGQPATKAIDPGAVDPIEMARAIAGTGEEQLRAGMRSAFRPVVLDEIFRRFPDYLSADRTRGVDAAVKFKITGRADGDADRYVVLVADGDCRVVREADVKPRVTITIDGADFLKLVTGNANPPVMFLRGKLRVSGDLAFAARLITFFKIPSAAG